MKIIHSIAAGGQTWAHRMRMLKQVLRIAVLFSLFGGVLVTSLKIAKEEPKENYQATWYMAKATVLGIFQKKIRVEGIFWEKLGGIRSNQPYLLVDKRFVLKKCKKQSGYFLVSLLRSLKTPKNYLSFAYIFALCLVYFFWRGNKATKKEHLSGIKRVSDRSLAFQLKWSFKASDLKMGRIPLLKNTETSHMLICGATRSGKTNALYQLLKQIRARGERAVIIDSTGIFTSAFYENKKDVLLNPYDERFPGWNPWGECEKEYHYEQLVNSLIPSMQGYDNFFSEAARAVLYSALRKRGVEGNLSIENFISSLLRQSTGELYEELRDTDASVYVDPKGDKTTVSVRATISNSLRHFRPLRDCSDPFSVRQWILSQDRGGEWLFISSSTDQRERLRNLMGMWFSVATNALMSREPLNTKPEKIWFVVDELHSLEKLEYLPKSLAEIGKYGGCLLLATQNISQIEEVYGTKVAESISDQCGTKVCFRQQSARLAEKMSDLFGKEEIKEVQEGLSYGAHQMRDGVSLSKHEKFRSTVSPTSILSLNNLEAYIKLPGSTPASKTKFKYKPIKTSH